MLSGWTKCGARQVWNNKSFANGNRRHIPSDLQTDAEPLCHVGPIEKTKILYTYI